MIELNQIFGNEPLLTLLLTMVGVKAEVSGAKLNFLHPISL